MNRAAFFRRLTFFSGLFASAPIATNAVENKTHRVSNLVNRIPLRKFFWNGHEPEILQAPWGQKVFYDRHTYADFQKGIWIEQGLSQEKISLLSKELNNKIDNKEINLRNGPANLSNGLWLIDVDGQQNIYLLETSEGLVLVDPSIDSTTDKVIEQIKSLGFNKKDVRFILLTHCHVDHAQSAAYWEEQGAEIFIHDQDKNSIHTGNEVTAWWVMSNEKDRYFPPVKKANSFHDGDALEFGDHKLFVCHTPGHTPGSSCFYLKIEEKHILISGDTLFHNGKHGWMGHPYSDYELYLKSLWKLKNFAVEGKVHNENGRLMIRNSIKFDLLLPGHTAISMDNVSRDIDKGIEILSYTIQQRIKGNDYQWTEPYTFFAGRALAKSDPIDIEYR